MQGHCLCGAVRFTSPDTRGIGACHCGFCRRWGGGPLLAVHCGPDVQFDGQQHIGVYASSEWAERAFCGRCGTHLYYYFKPKAGYSFAAGLFPGAADFTLTMEIFTDEKPAYYAFAGKRERLTGPEVMAKFGVGED